MRTLEEFLAEWETQLLSILFRGYHTTVTDPAMLFRMETSDATRLREKLTDFYRKEVSKSTPALPPAQPPKEKPNGEATRTAATGRPAAPARS